MSLMQLIYVSSAARAMSADDLAAILYASVGRNAVDGVSGVLLYAGGSFLQVLEGESETVERTFARIERDRRHSGIFVLDRAALSQRNFSAWHMAFRALGRADIRAHPGFAPWFEFGFDAAALGVRPSVALDILREFCGAPAQLLVP